MSGAYHVPLPLVWQSLGFYLLLALCLGGCEPAKTTPEPEERRGASAQGDVLSYSGHVFPRSLSFEAEGSRYRAEVDRAGAVTVHVQSLRQLSDCAKVQPRLLPDSCKCWAGIEVLDEDADGQVDRCGASFNTTCLDKQTDRLMSWQDLGLCRDQDARLREVVPIISKAHLAGATPPVAEEASKGLDLSTLCAHIDEDALLKNWRMASLKEQLTSEAEATRQEALKGETTQIPEDISSRVESARGCAAVASFSANMTDQKGDLLHHLACRISYELNPLTSEWIQTEESSCTEQRVGEPSKSRKVAATQRRVGRPPRAGESRSGNDEKPSLKTKAKSTFNEAKSSVKRFFRSW